MEFDEKSADTPDEEMVGIEERPCNEVRERCYCALPESHETPHVCDCGGSWRVSGTELLVYHLPAWEARLRAGGR